MIDEDAIRQRWEAVGSKLDERGRRLFAAGEVRTAGWGGLGVVSKITGLARSTINRGEERDLVALRRNPSAQIGHLLQQLHHQQLQLGRRKTVRPASRRSIGWS